MSFFQMFSSLLLVLISADIVSLNHGSFGLAEIVFVCNGAISSMTFFSDKLYSAVSFMVEVPLHCH